MAYLVDRVVICDAFREPDKHYQLLAGVKSKPPTDLAFVCEQLSIPLRHHDPLSDAEAAARIMLAAMERTA
jgi:hypothetical protein